MSLRTLVVDGSVDAQLPARIGLATSLAQAHEAKLFLVSPLEGYSAVLLAAEYAPAVAIEQHIMAERHQAGEVGRQAADEAARAGVRLEWRGVEGPPDAVLAAAGSAADAIILSQDEAWPTAPLVASVALTAGRPVLCVPRNGAPATTCGRRILVAWNGRREAVRALHDVSPFLRTAEQVVLFAADGTPDGMASCEDAAACLAGHGVAVERRHAAIEDDDTGAAILQAVARSGADMLVMGAYGRSRLREWVLGGTTRSILRSMTVPTLLSH